MAKKKPKYGAMRFRAKNPYRESPIHFFATADRKLFCRANPPFAKQRWRDLPIGTNFDADACCDQCYLQYLTELLGEIFPC